MDSAVGPGDVQVGDFAQRRQQGGPAVGVTLADAAQIAPVVALGQKAGHDRLLIARHGGLLPPVECLPPGQQGSGQDHVGQPDRRGQAPGEGPGVDDPPVPIHALHGGDGPPAVAELAVVVVLDDPALARDGPVQKLRAPRGRHRDPKRELVRGGQIGHRGPALLQRRRVHAAAVHGDPADRPATGQETALHGRVAGVLHRVDGLRAEEGHELAHQRLHAGADHDLLRRAAHAPVFVQQPCERLTQRRFALRLAALQQLRGVVDDLLVELGPGGVGKERNVHRRGRQQRQQGTLPCLVRWSADGRKRRRTRKRPLSLGGGQIVFYEIPAPGAGFHVALGQQQLVSRFHRGAADAQTGAKLPLGGQLFSVAQLALPDGLRHGGVKLVVHGRLALGIQGEREGKHGSLLCVQNM